MLKDGCLATSACRLAGNSGSLNLLELYGPVQARIGIALLRTPQRGKQNLARRSHSTRFKVNPIYTSNNNMTFPAPV